jgi:hypothetical protein
VLLIPFTTNDIKERIKNNTIETFRMFVKRLKLQSPNIAGLNLEQEKEHLLSLLAQELVTSEGKKKASSILGLRTFKEMYQRRLRENQPIA